MNHVPAWMLSVLVALSCSGSTAGGDAGPGRHDGVVIGAKDASGEAKTDAKSDTGEDGKVDPGTDACHADTAADAPSEAVTDLLKVCTPGTKSCEAGFAVSCSADGTQLQKEDCKGFPCTDGVCGKCVPGEKVCDGNLRKVCAGQDFTVSDCGELFCVDGECLVCVPGQKGCEGDNVIQCDPTGTSAVVIASCDPEAAGLACKNGECVSLCEPTERTNAGCEYWPLDLDQNWEYEAENMQFAVIVSNTSPHYTAHVKVFRGETVEKELSVPKNDLAVILLDPLSISEPGVAQLGRRLVSTVPIVAYQFNPLENVGVFSNDASLLLPTNVLGRDYRVISWKARDASLASYFTLIAVEDGVTEIELTVTAATQAGPGLGALAAGQTAKVSLNAMDTLHVKTSDACTDLTGTRILANKKIAVMGGHECANVPAGPSCGGAFCCCDHLEDQITPTEAWGKSYVLGRSFKRGKAPDTVRVLASEDGTSVTVEGATVSVPELAAGQYHEFEVDTDIVVSADKPILAAQYLQSQTSPTGCSDTCEDMLFSKKCGGNPFGKSCKTDEDCCPGVAGIGDPAMIVAVPIDQFRREYVFLVPNKYALDYINVIAPMGAEVLLDGAPIPEAAFVPVAGGPFAVARLPVTDGTHRIAATQAFGIVVYGWDQYVSYGYAGGMNVEILKGL